MDLAFAGQGGLRLLTQAADGTFTDVTATAAGRGGAITADCFGVWAADLEMDGDVDLVVGVNGAAPLALRNNGDGTWRQLHPFAGVVDLRGFVWGDFDGDGDPDAALLDAQGVLHVFENRQAGEFREMPKPADAGPRDGAGGRRRQRRRRARRRDARRGRVDPARVPQGRRVGAAADRGLVGQRSRRRRRERIGCFSPISTTTARSIWSPREADAPASGSPTPPANFERCRRCPRARCSASSI